jgi:hypothetical protein
MSARLGVQLGCVILGVAAALSAASSQQGPSRQVQQGALDAVVYVDANGCVDQQPRAGTGFVFERTGQIITAHHVVGGCSSVFVTYPAAVARSQRRFPTTVGRVYASGDLAILQVAAPPATPVLRRAPQPADRVQEHAGLGFQNAELSADALPVTFSPSRETSLDAFLPHEAQQELSRNRSLIDTHRDVLRFNRALEPGMSGGPIINDAGAVVGIVAGGLKAGTVPASWGWPAEWIANLLVSQERTDTPVTIVGSFFTLHDLAAVSAAARSNRTIRCGDLEFSYRGRRAFEEVVPGSDDQQRLQIITGASRPSDLYDLQFDVWRHAASGATALLPAGYAISVENGACVARSQTGPFQQVLWGRSAQPADMQIAAQMFEQGIMSPRVPYTFLWQWDPILTKFAIDNFGQPNLMAGPISQTRSDGLVFTRKGVVHAKTQIGLQGPTANSFETLATRSGAFMGAGTINDNVPPQLYLCIGNQWLGAGCDQMYAYFKEWTHFVLSTQLSTYPVF